MGNESRARFVPAVCQNAAGGAQRRMSRSTVDRHADPRPCSPAWRRPWPRRSRRRGVAARSDRCCGLGCGNPRDRRRVGDRPGLRDCHERHRLTGRRNTTGSVRRHSRVRPAAEPPMSTSLLPRVPDRSTMALLDRGRATGAWARAPERPTHGRVQLCDARRPRDLRHRRERGLHGEGGRAGRSGRAGRGRSMAVGPGRRAGRLAHGQQLWRQRRVRDDPAAAWLVLDLGRLAAREQRRFRHGPVFPAGQLGSADGDAMLEEALAVFDPTTPPEAQPAPTTEPASEPEPAASAGPRT